MIRYVGLTSFGRVSRVGEWSAGWTGHEVIIETMTKSYLMHRYRIKEHMPSGMGLTDFCSDHQTLSCYLEVDQATGHDVTHCVSLVQCKTMGMTATQLDLSVKLCLCGLYLISAFDCPESGIPNKSFTTHRDPGLHLTLKRV